MKLLRALILRPLRRDRTRTLLTILSVALGVGVVVAIDLAGDAATGSFRASVEALAGKTDFEISANAGTDERVIARLAALPLDARFEPVVEDQAGIPGAGTVPLYGMDFLPPPREPGRYAVVSRALARRLGVREGDPLRAEIGGLTRNLLAGTIADAREAEFLAVDIASAQQWLGRLGKLDRIDVYLGPHEELAAAERAIRAVLPASYSIDKPGARSEENQRMLRAFRWNLRVLSYISLVVGAFLIYNTIAVSVVRRRPEIGVLRAMGASRRGILWLFLGEALMFGLAGSLLGLAVGRLLAAGTVGMIAGTVNALYATSRPTPVALSAGEALTGILAGIAVAFFSALAPAREAMSVAPTEAMGRGAHEHRARIRWRRDLGWGALLAALAFAASRARPVDGTPVGGYVAALLAVGAAAMAAPALVLAVNRLTRAFARSLFGAPGLLAGRSLTASLARTSVVVAALATAISMMASVGIMVGSFRETVEVWLDSQLRADLYVRPVGRTGAGQFPPLAPEVLPLAEAVPGVAAVDDFHGLEIRYRGRRATLGAGSLDIVRRYGRLRFLPGEDRDAILRSLPGRDRAIVSEPFSNQHGVRPGDRIVLALGTRNVALEVAGVYYEYSSSQGYVIVDKSTLLRYLPGQPATNLAVYLKPGADAAQVEREISTRAAPYRVTVAPNRAIRRDAIAVFDRTFAITYALEAVAVVVAMLGAANSLLALVLDRRRELGLLRYLGASQPQLRRMVLLEAAFLGLLASILGLALGLVLSLLLIFVVNRQSFGWTIQFHPPVVLLATALFAVWCATVLAGLYPARIAARIVPIEVIHEE